MLVLARRPGQKVMFPTLGISVGVLRSKGSVIRLGIEAPNDIAILRDEVQAKEAEATGQPSYVVLSPLERTRRYELHNRLHLVTLRLQL